VVSGCSRRADYHPAFFLGSRAWCVETHATRCAMLSVPLNPPLGGDDKEEAADVTVQTPRYSDHMAVREGQR